MTEKQPIALEYFTGGVPAGAIFQLNAMEIRKLILAKPKKAIGRTLEEVCYIGLVSFFEAFCRDCFASLINICPSLIERLNVKGYDVTIDSLAALQMGEALRYSVGSLISEGFDFGNAKKINALYSALITITPFSKDDIKVYDRILSDRNLLVHHGGIYTNSYLHQRIASERTRAFMDSLIVDHDFFIARFEFLYRIAKKTVSSTHSAMTKQIASGDLSIEATAQHALRMLDWWDKDEDSPHHV